MTKPRQARSARERLPPPGIRADRPEADALSSQPGLREGVEHILRTRFACNQRCLFCCVDLSGRRVGLDEISAILGAIRLSSPGPRRLSISGGEPAGDPRLCAIVKLARKKGFDDIELQTNAVYLSRARLVSRLVDLGITIFFVSFHSFRPKIYDFLTGSRKQYPLALKGIANLLHHPRAGIAFNIVINRLNYADLPAHVEFLRDLGLRHRRKITVFFSVMNGAGHLKAPSLALDFRDAAGPLNEALRRCRKWGIAVERFVGPSAPPVCLAKTPRPYACDCEVDQTEIGVFPREFGGRLRLQRAKKASCRECRYARRCAGVSAEYARLYGVGALRPIRARAAMRRK